MKQEEHNSQRQSLDKSEAISQFGFLVPEGTKAPECTPVNQESKEMLTPDPVCIAERLSKRLKNMQQMSKSPDSNRSVDISASVISFKELSSYNKMSLTLSKMHKSVQQVYEEMPEREA